MSWNDTTKIMTEPLNLNTNGDIQQASGVNSPFLDVCIIEGTWNIWAKFKPVKSSKISPLTLDELKTLNYGLTIDVCGPNGNVSTFVSNYGSQWAYNQPDGSTGEWYRYQDLTNPSDGSATGYRGDANCFVKPDDCISPNSYNLNQNNNSVTFQLGINSGVNLKEGSIAPADLRIGDSTSNTPFSDMYFGLLFVSGTTTKTYKLVTAQYQMSGYPREGYSYPSITLTETSSHTLPGITTGVLYTVYPVLSVRPHTTMMTFENNDTIVALPNLPEYGAFTFKASEPQSTQTMRVQIVQAYMKNGARPTVKFQARYDKTGSASTTINDGYYEVRGATESGDTTGELWEQAYIVPASPHTMTYATWYTVGDKSYNKTNPGWIYVKVYRGGAATVFDEAWREISETEPEIE